MIKPRKSTSPFAQRMLVAALGAGVLLLSGCNKPSAPPTDAVLAPSDAPVTAASLAVPEGSSPAAVPVAGRRPASAQTANSAPAVYTPPSANQLYQMVAPIAVYPDKLVAQVLAASTYPQQVNQADRWLARNGNLRGGALADAADQQPWDPSVKSLVSFKTVLDQLADNLSWTTALGDAYYNDPADVMNAIQVMRQRAVRSGQLKSSNRLKVATGAPRPTYSPDPNVPVSYAGPIIVQAPPQLITIAPAQPDLVYIPTYNPQVIYGEPVRVYPGYTYLAPVQPLIQQQPTYSGAQVATSGALGFGLGIVVGAALEKHDWGWHAWGVDWGRHDQRVFGDGNSRVNPVLLAPQRPAVVYNNQTYISRSETVINNNVRNVRNVYNNAAAPQTQLQAVELRQTQQLLKDQQTVLTQQAQAQAQAQAQKARFEQQQATIKQAQVQATLQANQNQQTQLKHQEAQLQQQRANVEQQRDAARQQNEQLHQQQLQQAKAHELLKNQENTAAQLQKQTNVQEQAKIQQQAQAQAQAQARSTAHAQQLAMLQGQAQARQHAEAQVKAQQQDQAHAAAKSQEQASAHAMQIARAKEKRAQDDRSAASKQPVHHGEPQREDVPASRAKAPEQHG